MATNMKQQAFAESPSAMSEEERLRVLESLAVLDTEDEPLTDSVARAASHAFATPMATVSLVARDRQWYKAVVGLTERGSARDISFCTHAIESPDEVMVVTDALSDERFRDNPHVTGPANIRFYAGAPIIVRGHAIGSLCVLDTVARPDIGDNQLALLRELSKVVAIGLETRVLRAHAEHLEAEQRVAKARIAIALDAADMTVWSWTMKDDMIVNYGRGGADDIAVAAPLDVFLAAIVPEDRPAMDMVVNAARSSRKEYRAEYRLIEDPDTWWLAVGKPLEDKASGKVQQVTGIQANITQQKQHDEILETTAQEMRHRINNLIGLADALAGRTAREVEDKNEFIELYRSRLQALARTQKMLLSGEGRADLTRLVEAVVEPFRRKDRSVIDIDLPAVEVTNALTQVMTLVFHELTTNAMKYGALRWADGEVKVTGSVNGRHLRLRWAERPNIAGSGAPLEDYVEIASSGRGKSIVDRMVKAQGGTIDFDFSGDGVDVRLDLPLD
ncbi:MAG: HWE histidine kinase domain-containing protein [Pseudomonadota bacterium]